MGRGFIRIGTYYRGELFAEGCLLDFVRIGTYYRVELFREGGLLERGFIRLGAYQRMELFREEDSVERGLIREGGPIREGIEGCKHLSFIHSTKLLTLQSLNSSALTIRGRK